MGGLVGFSFYRFGWTWFFYVGSFDSNFLGWLSGSSFLGLASWILVSGVVWLDHRFVGWLFGSSFCRLNSWILILWDNWL